MDIARRLFSNRSGSFEERATARILAISDGKRDQCKRWGYYDDKVDSRPRILMAAGHGYGNLGDEAQCGACVSRWRRAYPGCKITILTPNPGYTQAVHDEIAEWAPRVAWFQSNTDASYFAADRRFVARFWLLSMRLNLSMFSIRLGIPLVFLRMRESRIIQSILDHDIVHISGGGFLTGKTKSRLWETCLFLSVCHWLRKPVIITGNNIGVFQTPADKWIARRGLKKVRYIGLRDRGLSEQELALVGIKGKHVVSTCDDAFLCPNEEWSASESRLASAGVDTSKPYAVVNFHHWGQAEQEKANNERRFAELCDMLANVGNLQIVFVSMVPSDFGDGQSAAAHMKMKSICLPYVPDFRAVRGIIGKAKIVFTMKHHPIVFAQGELVPAVSVALDEYYELKNRGAMTNIGHADYAMDRTTFFDNRATHILKQALDEAAVIKTGLINYKKAMEAKELDPYRLAADFI